MNGRKLFQEFFLLGFYHQISRMRGTNRRIQTTSRSQILLLTNISSTQYLFELSLQKVKWEWITKKKAVSNIFKFRTYLTDKNSLQAVKALSENTCCLFRESYQTQTRFAGKMRSSFVFKRKLHIVVIFKRHKWTYIASELKKCKRKCSGRSSDGNTTSFIDDISIRYKTLEQVSWNKNFFTQGFTNF